MKKNKKNKLWEAPSTYFSQAQDPLAIHSKQIIHLGAIRHRLRLAQKEKYISFFPNVRWNG